MSDSIVCLPSGEQRLITRRDGWWWVIDRASGETLTGGFKTKGAAIAALSERGDRKLARPSHAPGQVAAMKLTSDQLVALTDGPMDGRWYYAHDWQQLRATCTKYPPIHPAGYPLRYVDTGQTIEHPHEPDVPAAAAWRWAT
jgi:hypothetical protein